MKYFGCYNAGTVIWGCVYQLIKQYTKKHLAEKTDLLEALYLLTQSHQKITNHYKMEVLNVYRNLIIKLRN